VHIKIYLAHFQQDIPDQHQGNQLVVWHTIFQMKFEVQGMVRQAVKD
jgi:hypothetical protein